MARQLHFKAYHGKEYGPTELKRALRNLVGEMRGGTAVQKQGYPWVQRLAVEGLIVGVRHGTGPMWWSLTDAGRQLMAEAVG